MVPRHFSERRHTLPAGRSGFYPADDGIRSKEQEGEDWTLNSGIASLTVAPPIQGRDHEGTFPDLLREFEPGGRAAEVDRVNLVDGAFLRSVNGRVLYVLGA